MTPDVRLFESVTNAGDEARVIQAVALLQEQPGIGRPDRVPGTRELLVPRTRYLVPYRVSGQTIEILRVLHMSRRLPERW